MRGGREAFFLTLLLWAFILSSSTVSLAQDTVADLHGHIAYVGIDQNIYVFNPHTGTDIQLTNDASANKRYEWPTWATDGRLALFASRTSEDGRAPVFEAYVAEFDSAKPEVIKVYEGAGQVFNYAYWAPEDCSAGTGCRDLALLLSSLSQGMFVELVRVTPGESITSQTIPGGPPFYFSWSPNGSQMLWHRRVANRQRFDIFDAASNGIDDTLSIVPGVMNAPGWSPVDDRLLVGVRSQNRTQTDLVIVENGETRPLVRGLDGLVSFAWSPDGTMAAYRSASQRDYGPLFVVDTQTGETLLRSPGSGVIAFFWSPNSEKIAYITLANPPGSFNASAAAVRVANKLAQPELSLAWSVMSIRDGVTNRFGGFFPTEAMGYLLTYFDQFAQSHRVWSPDSRHLLYSEIGRGGPVISVLDTSRPDSVTVSIKQGTLGIWSYD